MGRAFVFTATAFLLVIPAIILAASFSAMTKVGNAGSVTTLKADKVYYIAMGVELDWEDTATSLVTLHGYDNATIEDRIKYQWAPDLEAATLSRFMVNLSIDESLIRTGRVNASGILYVNFTGAPYNATTVGGDVYLTGTLNPLLIKVGAGGLVGYDLTPPGAPTVLSPSCSFSPDMALPVNLSWNAVTDPESGTLQYRLQISKSSKTDSFGNFKQDIVFDGFTTGTSYSVGTPEGLVGNKKYYWHVKVQDRSGNWGSWSSTCKFETD